MAKTTVKKRAPKTEFKGYLNVNLTEAQDAEFEKILAEGGDHVSALIYTADEGYKVSFAEDEFNDGIVCTMYAKSTKLAWAGWTLSAWAASYEEAAALLMFKHVWICNRDWEQFRGVPQKSHAKRG
jgi:hypothetical protein